VLTLPWPEGFARLPGIVWRRSVPTRSEFLDAERVINRPPSLVLGRKDPLDRLRGRESDSHTVSLIGDEEKIDSFFTLKRGELDAFQKRTFRLEFNLIC